MKSKTSLKGHDILTQLRENAVIARVATFANETHAIPARGFVAITAPVSKRASKSAGSKTRTLKVRNWGVRANHFN